MKRIFVTLCICMSLLLNNALPASAEAPPDCAEIAQVGRVCSVLDGDEIVILVAGREVARFIAPVVRSTVRVTVPGPRVTVPGPRRTVPGPTRTIYVTRNSKTITIRPSPSAGQTIVERDTVTITPSPHPKPSPAVKVVEKERVITLSIPKAVGFSVGLVLLGILIALLLLWALYTIGYKEGNEGDKKFLRDFLNELRRRN